MYTLCIGILVFIAVCLLIYDFKIFKNKSFVFWLVISSIWGWTEFITMLRYDIPAWFFNPDHVTGLSIAGVTIEDIFFCPGFSISFYWIYKKLENIFTINIFNPSSKLIFFIVLCSIGLVFYALGSGFGYYLSLKMAVGLTFIIPLYNKLSFRHMGIFMMIVFGIAFFWDVIAINLENWFYVTIDGTMCKTYCGIIYKILNAVFPIEIFYYYVSGAVFCFGGIAFCENYFKQQHRIK